MNFNLKRSLIVLSCGFFLVFLYGSCQSDDSRHIPIKYIEWMDILAAFELNLVVLIVVGVVKGPCIVHLPESDRI